jgi:hypothetical protein
MPAAGKIATGEFIGSLSNRKMINGAVFFSQIDICCKGTNLEKESLCGYMRIIPNVLAVTPAGWPAR